MALSAHSFQGTENSAYGLCLLALSLVLDGVTTSTQVHALEACSTLPKFLKRQDTYRGPRTCTHPISPLPS